jgi:hypothetical protein
MGFFGVQAVFEHNPGFGHFVGVGGFRGFGSYSPSITQISDV